MHRFFTAAFGAAAIVAVSTSLAFAGTTGNGSGSGKANVQDLHLRVGSHAGRCIVTFHLGSGPVSWAYDPATGTINQLPTPVENTNPTSGIGIVVKKNPGSSAARLTANSDGTTWDLPTTMDPGNYDIVVTVQAHAINTKGTGSVGGRTTATGASMTSASVSKALPAQTTSLTFHVIVASKIEKNPFGNRSATLDPNHPPTVVVGSGTSSSQ